MSRSDTLLKSVYDFYSNDEKNADILHEILDKKNGVSLRNIEWFVTNYSKKTNLSYTTKAGKVFTVHCSYKSTLDGYSKKLFDPFCRSEKLIYTIPFHGVEITTTVAQLNFIKWCIVNNIIDYIREHKGNLGLASTFR